MDPEPCDCSWWWARYLALAIKLTESGALQDDGSRFPRISRFTVWEGSVLEDITVAAMTEAGRRPGIER